MGIKQKLSSPEYFLVFSLGTAAIVAALATLIPGVGFSFWLLFGIMAAFDIAMYVAVRTGLIRNPADRKPPTDY